MQKSLEKKVLHLHPITQEIYTHSNTFPPACRKTSVFLSRKTGIWGNFVGRIKGAKCPFDLQFLTWDFS